MIYFKLKDHPAACFHNLVTVVLSTSNYARNSPDRGGRKGARIPKKPHKNTYKPTTEKKNPLWNYPKISKYRKTPWFYKTAIPQLEIKISAKPHHRKPLRSPPFTSSALQCFHHVCRIASLLSLLNGAVDTIITRRTRDLFSPRSRM